MNRIVIVARTRMRGDHVCIGGHDLDRGFRGVRLLDKFGNHWTSDSPFMVGDRWAIRYIEKVSARPPHVEDVFVMEYRQAGRIPDLRALVLRSARPWRGSPGALFDGTVRSTETGAGYIPANGRLPCCSTGYWIPDEDLVGQRWGEKARFALIRENTAVARFTWVGVSTPPERIEAGALVRVSLSRLFRSETAPEGYYVQLSGVIRDSPMPLRLEPP